MPLSKELDDHINWCQHEIPSIDTENYKVEEDFICKFSGKIPVVPVIVYGNLYDLKEIYDFQFEGLKFEFTSAFENPMENLDIQIPDEITKDTIKKIRQLINGAHTQINQMIECVTAQIKLIIHDANVQRKQANIPPPLKIAEEPDPAPSRKLKRDHYPFPFRIFKPPVSNAAQEAMMKKLCFYAGVDRMTAENVLSGHPAGMYLLRPSSMQEGKYVISIVLPPNKSNPKKHVEHFLFKYIVINNDSRIEVGKDQEIKGTLQYSSLEGFLDAITASYNIVLIPLEKSGYSPREIPSETLSEETLSETQPPIKPS
ncbi:MAG: SH2 domain-containing protein [Gammaproteobacteria bacterium]